MQVRRRQVGQEHRRAQGVPRARPGDHGQGGRTIGAGRQEH